MSNPIKVSFEVTDNWDIDDFRHFVKMLMSDDKYEVFIVSNDDTSSYIVGVGNILNLPSSNIIICNFANDKIQAIQDNAIQIHLDDLQSFTIRVENETDAYGILVTRNLNKYELRPDYQIVFDRVVKMINSETNC